MSTETYVGKIDRLESADKGPSLCLMEPNETQKERGYEGKRFRYWEFENKARTDKSAEAQNLEKFYQAGEAVLITFHKDSFTTKDNKVITKNMIDKVEASTTWDQPQGIVPEKVGVNYKNAADILRGTAADLIGLANAFDNVGGGGGASEAAPSIDTSSLIAKADEAGFSEKGVRNRFSELFPNRILEQADQHELDVLAKNLGI